MSQLHIYFKHCTELESRLGHLLLFSRNISVEIFGIIVIFSSRFSSGLGLTQNWDIKMSSTCNSVVRIERRKKKVLQFFIFLKVEDSKKQIEHRTSTRPLTRRNSNLTLSNLFHLPKPTQLDFSHYNISHSSLLSI